MGSGHHFLLSQPTGPLSAFIQAIWSASVEQSETLIKPLLADAGSGIVFNFVGDVAIGDDVLPQGVIMLPVKKRAENFVLPSGAQLAGIRFYPAIGYGVLGHHYERPTLLAPQDDQLYHLYQIFSDLRMTNHHEERLQALRLWADQHLDVTNVIPDSLEKALDTIEDVETLERISENTPLSQRQIERNFKRWLGMTPKHYQRILRVKKAICFLRENNNHDLANIAQQFGFSDQAHMTREFRAIARMTPGQV